MVERIGVVGAGTMGAGIALVGLYAGLRVTLYDIAPDALSRARAYIEKFLVKKGQQTALDHLQLTSELTDMGSAEVVIEAALEDLSLKKELFAQLSSICDPSAVLTTNTSTFSITEIAAAAVNPSRVAGLHFFNPAPVLPLVEVIRAAQTSGTAIDTLVTMARQLGKTPVVARDTPGFIVNRVARPFYLEALRLLSEGAASVEQIDTIVQLGGGFKMGPFQLMDLIGIDISLAATRSIYEQSFYQPRYRPSLIQAQKVQAGTLGRKTGRGFYEYGDGASAFALPTVPEMQTVVGEIVTADNGDAGLPALCQRAGYTLVRDSDKPAARVIQGQVSKDSPLSEGDFPTYVNLTGQTLAEVYSVIGTKRVVGYDGLFIEHGRLATLVASHDLSETSRQQAQAFFESLGLQVIWMQDSPGLVLPRIVCQIINEAVFAVGDGAADMETIDSAMRMGVSYPKGPFEWGREIGFRRVVVVLDHLYEFYHEERYAAAPLLRRLAHTEDNENHG
jgi:3-hydroxybutyryl-CoA dehydrogenase